MSANPMRICLLSQEYPTERLVGGIATFNHQLATGLARQGHDITVITETAEKPDRQCYNSDGVSIYPIRLRKFEWHRNRPGWQLLFRSLSFAAGAWQAVQQLHKRHPFDVVEGQDAHGPLLFVQRRMKIPTVARLHTPASMTWSLNQISPDRGVGFIDFIERTSLLASSALVSVSRSLADIVQSWLKVPPGSIQVVHNAVDLEFFQPDPDRRGPAPLFLFAGRLEPRKGPDALIECVPEVLRHCPSARFRFVGSDAGMGEFLRRRVEELRIQDAVEFTSAKDSRQMLGHFHEAWAVILPSRTWENFSMVGLEALACGCPVIANSVGGFREMITHGESGFLVPAGHPASLTVALLSLLRSDTLRNRLAVGARARAESAFGQPRLVRETVALYRAVVANAYA
jgi:glycogen synthase